MAYVATIGELGKEFRVEVVPLDGGLYKVVVDGEKELVVDVRRHGCCVYSVLREGESYEVDVDEQPAGGYGVLVKGEHFHIHLMDEMKKKLLSILGEAVGAGTGEVTTAMPGKVVKVLVSEGDQVKKDQPLVILEAMKMENAIKAPYDGVVKTIKVEEGETVEANAVLVVLEPAD
ncbi:MAG TPA: biotin/lipoyl-binding protein [Thermosulfidibacter takaii]|uniref:Biotin/lipoyl-binding protein n=1 Tax=Thermosulfidibacter takaii TaxID=412593 RepID=A0A7C0U5Z8_9BACT|nr:biotin/lipoyl-binding protein [Thermosulfidibacter takaii]